MARPLILAARPPFPTSYVYRCLGPHAHRPPVLGVIASDGTLRVLKDSLKLVVRSGPVLLGCRDCGLEQLLQLPMTQDSAAALTGYPLPLASQLTG